MEDSKLRKVYDTIVKEGYDVPDFATFETDMRDDNKLTQVRDRLVEDGYELPEFGQFKIDMFGAPQQGFLGKAMDRITDAVNKAEEMENRVEEQLPDMNERMKQRVLQGQTTQGALERFRKGDNYAVEGTPEYDWAQRTQMRNMFAKLPEEQRNEVVSGARAEFRAKFGREAQDDYEVYEWMTGGKSVRPEYATEDTPADDIAKYNGYSANEIKAGWGGENARNEYMRDTLIPQLESAAEKTDTLLKSREETVKSRYWKDYEKNAGTPGLYPELTMWGEGRAMDDEWRYLKAADNINKETKMLIDAAKNDRGFWRGFGRRISDLDTWIPAETLLEYVGAKDLMNIDPDKATSGQKALMEALALRAAAEEQYEGDVRPRYKAGETVAEMIPLAAEMLVNPLSGTGKAAAKATMKKVAKKEVKKKIAGEAAEKALKKWQKKFLIKSAGYAGSMAGGYGMAATTSLPKVAINSGINSVGRAQYQVGKDGNVGFSGFKPGESYGKEFLKEFGRTTFEHATGQMGAEWLSGLIGKPLGWIGKGVMKIPGAKSVTGKVGDLLDNKVGDALKKLAKDVNYQGPIEEFGEEFVSALHTASIDGMDSLKKWFEGDNLETTAIAVTMPALLGLGASVTYGAVDYERGAKAKSKQMQAYKEGFEAFADMPEDWKTIVINLNSPSGIIDEMKRIYNDPIYTDKQKIAALMYGARTMAWMGTEGVKGVNTDENVRMLNEMLGARYREGYEQEPTGENAVKEANEYTNARNEVVKILGLAEDADVDAMLEGRTAEEIAMGDTDVEDAVNNYIQARARRDGFRERYQEERDRQFAESDRSVDERTNNGTVYGVATENGEAFITSGTVVLNEEGEIDYANSEGLVVMFPDGTKKPVKRGSLPGKVTVQNAEDLKAAGRTAIEERWRAELESAENAYVEQQKRAEGVVFDITDKEGTHRVEVVKEGDEMSSILVDGEQMQISTEMLNALRGEAGVTQTENEVAPVVEGDNAEKVVEPVGEVAAPKTALEQIPRNENNIPLYEQVDSELAWDGVVEEAGGNEETAMVAVNSMIADKQDALKKAEKAKAKAGVTITEKIAAENERVANIERAKADLAKWEEIAGVKAKREAAQAENVAQPVAETAPVEEVETPQATNEMQEADLENAEKGQKAVEQAEGGKQSVTDEVLAMANKTQQARFADHAKSIAEKLGVVVTVHNDESMVTNRDAMKAIDEGGLLKGWYNPNTGEIALFLPAMESMRDVESTILHEAVSHYGIKHFLGKEDFDKFLDGVWDMMPASKRAEFLQYVGADMKNPSKAKMRQAADEYVAHIAEKMDLNELEKSVWQRFVDYVMDVLRKAGFKNLRHRDVEAVIRASYANLRQNGGNSQVTGQGETMASKKSGRNEGTMFRIAEVNDKFNSELQQQIDGTLPEGHIYELGMPSEILRATGIPELPIQLNSKKLREKSTEYGHDYNLEEVKDLVNALNEPLAIFAYGDKTKAQNIVVEIQSNDKNFVVGLALRPKVGGRVLEINSIRNVFPKDNAEWLNWVSQGKALYLDKERVQTLIDQQRTNLADVDYLDLNSIANVINNFENPTVESEKVLAVSKNSSKGGTMFSKVTPEMDSEYIAAVENGDMETAERLVKEAAKLAMPDTKVVDEDGYPMVVYHGSADEFTVFGKDISKKRAHTRDNSYFFSKEKAVSEDYGDVLYGAYLNLRNPLVVDFEGRSWRNTREVMSVYYARNNEVLKSGFASEEEATAWRDQFLKDDNAYSKDADYVKVGPTIEQVGPSSDEYVAKAQAEGYDGLIIENVVDAAGGGWVLDENNRYTIRKTAGADIATTDYVAFEPNQIKSADAVTYDDKGNVISLNDRFDEEKEDIRFRKVFHGSGAKFDKFDHSFMSTGEGAQIYGWGTYVSEVEGIGRAYANSVTANRGAHIAYNGKPLLDVIDGMGHWWKVNKNRLASAGSASDLRSIIEGLRIGENANERTAERFERQRNELLAAIDNGEITVEKPRNLYTVEIPDDNGSNYLHWEKRIPMNVVNSIKKRLFDVLAEGDYKGAEKELKRELDDVFKAENNDGYLIYGNISAYLGGDKAASQFLNDMGFVGISYPAEATTGGRADGARNYVIFNEDDAVIEDRTMFRRANKNQEVFVSNAQRAVEGIKQEKATPEQWIAMLKKNGGLKAGEEAWLGLEEWLTEKGKVKGENGKTDPSAAGGSSPKTGAQSTVTKQEILDFIGENQIQIEEVNYTQFGYGLMDEATRKLEAELKEIGWDAMVEKYPGFDELFEVYDGELLWSEERASVGEYEDFIIDNKIVDLDSQSNAINETREKYTTEGLERKREIALTVPTIEPYNESDEVHFGDAGDGRAVAWVRFGETTDSEGNRVLVIDEIQSKRHQDGREKGYKNPNAEAELEKVEDAYREAIKAEKAYNAELKEKYGYDSFEGSLFQRTEQFVNSLTEEEKAKREELKAKKNELAADYYALLNGTEGVPAAPFDKNWHELAMKRMLRLAAEEGFDKVAWTTGEQQAERYNLGKAFNDIEREDNPNIDGRRFVLNGANVETFQVDENGNIVDSTLAEAKGKPLADVVGKDMAVKMMSLENGDMLEGEDLRIGGEGMKGFYDRMLPSFVSKYTKKWGAKVGEVTMPNLGENNTMHSVDVTPEMQESVMEGQTMFRFIGKKGAENLDKAEEATTRLDNLNVAREMETAGKDAKAIKLATGWERGADGKWRYETEDAKVNRAAKLYNLETRESYPIARSIEIGRVDDNSTIRLADLVKDDELFKAYPEMEEYFVSFEKMDAGTEGSHSFEEKMIRINKDDIHSLESTLVHEIQHAIQSIEGFAKGGNTSSSNGLIQEVLKTLHVDSENAAPSLSEVIGAIENGYITRSQHEELVKIAQSHGYDDVVEYVRSLSPYSYYRRLAGEVESRNVEERLGMSPEERRNKLAEETEDVRREDQIFLEDALKSAMMGSRVDARMAEVASHFDGKELSAEQRAVADVFGGKADNLTISVKTQDGNTRNVEMRQGNDLAGAKHSLYAHYGTTKGVINADDLLLIPDVIANGERTENGKKAVYKLDVNGTKYTVVTYVKQNKEEFHNFYSNKKGQPSQSVNASIGDTHSARITEELASTDKGSTSSAEMQEGETLFSKKELTPEQKKKQEALKENAKAIRRLHNVRANYPITALRNLGFALETQEQREMHDRLFAERDAMSGRENAVSVEVNPQAMTLQERITDNLLKMAEQNKDNVELRLSAIRAYGRDLANVIKLMRAQRGYDRNTVNMFVSLAKMYLRNNAMSGMSSYDISRLLGLISRANGGYGPQVMRAAEQIAEIITKSHTRELEDIVRKQIKTGAEKVNASGVVVQGGVDVVGKRVLNTFRDAINMTSEEEFEKAFREAFERAAKFPNDVEAKAACDAMVIAKEYRDNIVEAKKQESELLKSINQYSDIRSRYDRGEITRKEYNEFVDAVRKSLIELRSRMVDDYQRIIHALGGDISEGIKRAKEFRERELARVEKIHNMAEADMSGVSKSAERKKRGFWRKATDYVVFKNPLAKVIAEGLGTYDEFMKFFGRNAIGGKGRLYDYFIGRYTEIQNQEWVEKQKDIKKIDERCEMVFGKGFKDVMRDSEKNSGVVLEYWNGGERVSRDLSIGQLMYIYMTAKQTDGEMKLRGMGITEETVNKAVAVLPAKYKVFADWVQSDFLPEMRPRLNEVHKRMFGASMSEVKNYFPLVVNTDARQAEVDLNSVMPINPSTITGSIIKRKVNATPLNLESNAFDVLLNHVSDMEHWAAFAEFTRDNNTLIGDKDFMNRVKNSRDLRFGDGVAIWNNFVETARIATGNYRAKKDEWANVMKGVSSAKITFGYYTALKQFLSAPAMWLEASTASIIKATVNPLGSWRWAIENLPGFEERWKGRTAGNERLADSDSDWSIWDNRVVKAAREVGMTPNAFIDAVVVSTGARAVYDSRKRFYKALGLSQEEQHKRALKDAAVAYNETQQSAQGAYLSILQKEGGFKAMVMTLYRNSQMAYSRKVTGSMAELYKKAVRWKDILDDEEKKYLEMGLSEENAKKEANKALLKSAGKDVATLVMFGYVLNMVWYLGEQLPYLLFGDDEEEKEKIMDTALKIGATGMFEGFALGNVAKDLYVKGVTGNRYSSDLLTTPFASDAEKIINRFANDGTLAGMSQLLILGAETATGISPQRLIDDVAAAIDFCNGDLDKATEVTLLTTRLAKVPQSQIDKLYLEEALGGDVVALAERYAEYKRLKDYPLNIGDDKILKKYAERFKKAHNEDLKEIVRDENAYEGYFSNVSPEEKIKLAGYRGEYLEELTGKKAEEVLTGRELVYYTLYGRKEQNLVYSAMTTPDDVDDEICIEMMMSELKPIQDEYMKVEDWKAYEKLHEKELGMYEDLKRIEGDISYEKSKMKENPVYAEEGMTEIRTLRAEAVELINKYRNE